MSSILISAILILIVVVICLALVSINNKHREKAAGELLARFQKLEQENGLTLASREILENFIISLDKEHLKVLFLKKTDDGYDSLLIDLKQVKSFSKRKIYRSANIGTVKREKIETHVDKIVLEFHFKDMRDPVQALFYESDKNHSFEMSELESLARDWEVILTKTINKGVKKTA